MFSNIEVYGLDRAAVTSGYAMAPFIDGHTASTSDYERLKRLGSSKQGEGHDSALKGIVVNLDVTLPHHVWLQAQRYHWFDIVTSQSKMHRLLFFDLTKQMSSNVTQAAIDNLINVIDQYKIGKVTFDVVLDNCPCGLLLTAGVTTNYLQLKNIYLQRRTHKLKAWQDMCDQMEQLPMFLELIRRA